MSFGFSTGDFLTTGKLIAEIISCLNDASGSASEYQQVLRELHALDNGLKTLNRLQPPPGSSDAAAPLDAIKCSALTCQIELQDFLNKTRKYRALGRIERGESALTAAGRKIDWRLRMRSEAEKLRLRLSLHVAMINMQLGSKGLESMFEMSQEMWEMHAELSGVLDQSSRAVADILEGIKTQQSLLKRGNWMLSGMKRMIMTWIPSKIEQVVRSIATLCATTQKVYELVVEMRSAAGLPIYSTMSWVQQSVIVKDISGQVAAFPSQWGLEGISSIIANMIPGDQFSPALRCIEAYPVPAPGQTLLLCPPTINVTQWAWFLDAQMSRNQPDAHVWIIGSPNMVFNVRRLDTGRLVISALIVLGAGALGILDIGRFYQDWYLMVQAKEVPDCHQAGRALATMLEEVKAKQAVCLHSLLGWGSRTLFPGLLPHFISMFFGPNEQHKLRMGASWERFTIGLKSPLRSQHQL